MLNSEGVNLPLTALKIYYLAPPNRKIFALLLTRFTCLRIDPLIKQAGISVMLGAPFLLLTFLWAAKKSESTPMDGRRNSSRGQLTQYTYAKR